MARSDKKRAARPSANLVREMTVTDGWSMTRIVDGWRIAQPNGHSFEVNTKEDSGVSLFFREMGPWLATMIEEGRQRSDERMSEELRAFLEGMSVSMDVSTGEHDESHRYFGEISEVMDYDREKHGVMLLVQNPEPNFDPKKASIPPGYKLVPIAPTARKKATT